MADDERAHSERVLQANGIRLRVIEGGQSSYPPVLLLHGIYNRADAWLTLFPRLADRYHVVAPDLRGHYRSDWPASGYDLADYAGDSLALLDQLAIGQATVVGHSLGALAAVVMAASAPERVRALVLEDPPPERSPMVHLWLSSLLQAKRASRAVALAILRQIYPDRGPEEWERQFEWLRATSDGPFESLLGSAAATLDDFFATLARVRCPTLLLQADPAAGGALRDPIAARAVEVLPRGLLRRCPGVGHSIHLANPEWFLAQLEPFLAEHAG